MVDVYFGRFVLPEDLHAALMKCRSIAYIETQEELDELVFGPTHSSRYDVVYNIVGKGSVKEAEVIRCKNGASARRTSRSCLWAALPHPPPSKSQAIRLTRRLPRSCASATAWSSG